VYCSKCGQPNLDTAKFCTNCGSALSPVGLHIECPTLPSFSESTADPETLYRAFIGPNNQHYYLEQFQKFDRAGKASATWHWPAFFVTWFWLLYRKMWLAALLYFSLPFLVGIVSGTIRDISPGLGGALASLLGCGYLIAIFVWYPMNASALYYTHCQKMIQEAKATSSSPNVQLGMLAARGGTSSVVIVLILVFSLLFSSILAAIALPAYQTYVIRAKISEALMVGTQAEQAVSQYYKQQQKLPATLSDAGFSAQLPKFVKTIELDDRADGTIAITMTNVQMAEDQKIYLVPTLQTDQSLSWTCTSAEIRQAFLPKVCRPQQ